jgi:PAS domain S-box-containing protein
MLADLLPQFVWMCSPDGQSTYFNQRWVDFTGLPLARSIGEGWAVAFHPDELASVHKAWNHSVATGESYRFEGRLRRFDGAYCWFLMLGLPQHDANGAIIMWFGTCTDIETSKLAEAELHQSERELRLRNEIARRFLEVRGKPVFGKVLDLILDTTGSAQGLFAVMEESGLIAYPTATTTDRPQAVIAMHDPSSEWHGLWEQGLAQKETLYRNQSPGPAGDPRTFHRAMVVPIHFHGELVGQIGVANRPSDYTESDKMFLERLATNLAPLLQTRILWNREESARELAEQELQNLNRELDLRVQLRTDSLKAINKELEAFSYSVSHDLRAPLRHVDGFLTLLFKRSHESLDEQSLHFLNRAIEASRRMGKLIDDLLQFSRLGRSEIRRIPVNLSSVIADVRREFEPEMLDRTVEWYLTPLPAVATDPAMLRQVMQNLIGNALKFTRSRTVAKIEIGSQPASNGDTVFFVRDNGAGFDMRYYNKMFEVFQRLHSETDFEGTGIGLAIVRRVVERQGGSVWAEGAVEKGATFYFTLPSNHNNTSEERNDSQAHLVS